MKIGKRGQITIPKKLREEYGLQPGTEVELVELEDGIRIQESSDAHPVDKLRGKLKRLKADS